MTDEQVIKALEYCNSTERGYCLNKCPYYNYSANCTQEMIKDTLDLIKRQKEEIDYWKRNAFDDCMERGRIYQNAKSEAYKEFAERLTDRIAEAVDISHDNPNGSNYDLTDVFDTIHNLVKELTEESNGIE